MAAVHVLPPSVDTSTFATPEPVPSDELPVTVTLVPLTIAPFTGLVTDDVGEALSTVTEMPAPGVSMFPALSVALDLRVYLPSAGRVQV